MTQFCIRGKWKIICQHSARFNNNVNRDFKGAEENVRQFDYELWSHVKLYYFVNIKILTIILNVLRKRKKIRRTDPDEKPKKRKKKISEQKVVHNIPHNETYNAWWNTRPMNEERNSQSIFLSFLLNLILLFIL